MKRGSFSLFASLILNFVLQTLISAVHGGGPYAKSILSIKYSTARNTSSYRYAGTVKVDENLNNRVPTSQFVVSIAAKYASNPHCNADTIISCFSEYTKIGRQAWRGVSLNASRQGALPSTSFVFEFRELNSSNYTLDEGFTNYNIRDDQHGLAACIQRHQMPLADPTIPVKMYFGQTNKPSQHQALFWRGARKQQLPELFSFSRSNPHLQTNGMALDSLRDPPVDNVQFILSVIAHAISPSNELRVACIGCMANVTGTVAENWGLYNLSRLGDKLIQMSFFVDVTQHLATSDFPRSLASYIGNQQGRGLTQCVRNRNRSFIVGSLDAGLLPAPRQNAAIVSRKARLAPWIVGAIVGGLALVTLIAALIIVRVTAKKTYSPDEYSKPATGQSRPELTEEQEINMMA